MYLNYEQQLSKLTLKQRSVVENTNVVSPIRIDGPAGTGKTASMILRAYFLLKNARAKAEPFSIVFFAHSESTKCEIESAFSLLENADSFLSEKSSQHTKSAEQKQIPICFALDYGQAIGDRGNTNRDYIETAFGEVERNDYKTVFRCSQQITDFCAAISASGALMFQNDYRDPYDIAASGFTQQEEAVCDIPRLYMYSNEEEMIESLKGHVDRFKQETQCKNYDIALISFEDTLLIPQNVEKLSSLLGKKMYVLKNRQTSSLSRSIKTDDPIILSDPYNVNGLEFKCVILFGVDEGRLPQNTGVSDISANYIKYIAFNQLYLASSRAKYRLILIGNSLHGVSSCLQYALESGKLETGDQV